MKNGSSCCGCFVLAATLLLTVFTGPVHAADVTLYLIKKGSASLQTSSSAPVEIFPNGYGFSAEVYPVLTNWLTSAGVESPGTYAFLPLEIAGTHYEWQRSLNTLAGLDANYGNGLYLLQIATVHDGSRQLALSLQGSLYPQAPHIGNFPAAQAIYAGGYFLLTWDRFGAGTPADFIRLTVRDSAGNQCYQSPQIGEQTALNGTVTWALLEPGRLAPNSNYTAKLTFQKNMVLDRGSYPGALGVTAYYAETQFRLTTLAARGPDVKDVDLARSVRYVQAGDTAPIPDANPAQFSATVKTYGTSLVAQATLLLPTNSLLQSTNLPLQPDGLTLRFVETARTDAQLDARCGTGVYGLNLSTAHDGVRSLTINLPTLTNPLPPPQIVRYSSLQNIRASKPFTVGWLPCTNGTATDFIQLTIRDGADNKVFATPDLGSPNALNGLATNALVPAGALQGGQPYKGQLMFRRNASLNTTNYPGVLCLADHHTQTTFAMKAAPADIARYALAKGQVFQQTGPGASVALPTNGCFFTALLQSLTSNSVSSASLITPSNSSRIMDRSGQTLWALTNTLSTPAALNLAFPAGRYTLRATCANDGTQALYLSLPTAFPPAPHLLDYDPAQLHDAFMDFRLAWDRFTTAGTNSFIQLTIRNPDGQTVFATPDFGNPGALSGAAVSAFVPAGVLGPNSFYEGSLLFESFQLTNATAYAQIPGRASMVSVTRFRFGTFGPGNPPVLRPGWDIASRSFLLDADVVPNQSYLIEYCTNFPPQWLPLFTNSSSSNILEFADPGAPARAQTFYRIRVWP